MGVIIIIAVFWLLGLLMAWSSASSRHAPTGVWKKSAIPTRTRISAGPLTPATWTSGDASPADKDRRIPRLHNKKGYPMENTNLKRLAAMCAAAASLSTLGLAGTAMAVETPTTSDTGTASITLNAAQGNTLTGHTFDFYRLGSYGDITANGDTDVKSLTVNKIDDASDKWIAAANAKAGIADLQGFDAAGDLAHVGKDGEPTGTVQGQLREAAKQLAASASASKIQAVKSVAGTGDTMTVSDLPNGLYLIVDSDGVPMIVGTPVQGTKTLNGVTLGTLTVKSKTTTIDKKVSRDRLNKGTFIDSKAGGTEDSASFTVGETVDFKYVFTLPNMQAATQTVVKDTMNGLTLAGDPAFSIDGKTVTPSVAKGENGDGFTATFDQAFIKANSAKQVTVTYKATVANAKRAAQASNTAAISTTFYDGTAASKTTVDSNDTATVSAYDVNIKKTNWDGKQALQGAGFKIQNKDTGKWMKQDPKTGSWTYVDTQGEASQFLTGENGQLNIAGLGAGNYHVVESKVPDNMTSLVTVEFDMTITDGGKVSTSADTNKLITGQPTNDNKWTITVRNIDALTELPQTGGLLGNTMIGVVVIAMAGGVAYLTVQSKRRREAHTL